MKSYSYGRINVRKCSWIRTWSIYSPIPLLNATYHTQLPAIEVIVELRNSSNFIDNATFKKYQFMYTYNICYIVLWSILSGGCPVRPGLLNWWWWRILWLLVVAHEHLKGNNQFPCVGKWSSVWNDDAGMILLMCRCSATNREFRESFWMHTNNGDDAGCDCVQPVNSIIIYLVS